MSLSLIKFNKLILPKIIILINLWKVVSSSHNILKEQILYMMFKIMKREVVKDP